MVCVPAERPVKRTTPPPANAFTNDPPDVLAATKPPPSIFVTGVPPESTMRRVPIPPEAIPTIRCPDTSTSTIEFGSSTVNVWFEQTSVHVVAEMAVAFNRSVLAAQSNCTFVVGCGPEKMLGRTLRSRTRMFSHSDAGEPDARRYKVAVPPA